MSEREMLARMAVAAGWEVVAQNGELIIERGPERIEIEYSTSGIPRKVKRISADGLSTVLTQNYIRMIEVMEWIETRVSQ